MAKPATPPPPRAWLLMLHLSASAPNLEEPLKLDLEELGRALGGGGTSTTPPAAEPELRVFVIVQIDGPNGVFRRYWIKKGGHEYLASGVSGPGTLLKFVMESVAYFRADRTALVLWGHSVGVGHSLEVPKSLMRASSLPHGGPKGKSAKLALDDLAATLVPGPPGVGGIWHDLKCLPRRLNIIGFDACFMASIEIAYELRFVADFILAPQAAIPLKGWHYDLLLEHILHNDSVITKGTGFARKDALTLGRAVVAQVGLSRSSPETLSLLDLSKVTSLERPLRRLVLRLCHLLHSTEYETQLRRMIFAVFDEAIWAGARQFLDLTDLCRLIASRIPDQDLRDFASRVLEVLAATRAEGRQRVADRLVVDQLSMLDVPLGGVSIFCPWPRATVFQTKTGVRNVELGIGDYLQLRFVQETHWGRLFLNLDNYLSTERLWIRREIQDGAHALADAVREGRVDDPKPSSRVDDPKPSGRVDDPKPAGRGDDPRPYGYRQRH